MPAVDLTVPAVSLRHVSKDFGVAHRALDDLSLDVMPGEVHGLLGQNGSGKSTLIKILAGYHAPEPGAEFRFYGETVSSSVMRTGFRELGMAFVHQNLGLADGLSVLDNMRIGRYRCGVAWRIHWREERQSVRGALKRFGLDLDPDIRVGDLPQGTRATVAIARALDEIGGQDRGLLILDEPTPYLPQDSITALFDAIGEVARSGMSILFVSHRLDEAFEVTDRVTVLRDGRGIGTRKTADLDMDSLIEMIVGRRLGTLYPRPPERGSQCVLAVRELDGNTVHDFNLDLYSGEVLGVTGLLGSGFEELPYLLMGATEAKRGSLAIGPSPQVDMRRLSIRERIKRGMVLVPANRESQGVALSLTAGENITVSRLSQYFRRFFMDKRAEESDVLELMRQVDMTPAEPARLLGTFSGGNQQKAVIAKGLSTVPLVLIGHEPTQGVDIGARKMIFSVLAQATDAGCAVILASFEYADLAHLCDRVLVFRDGRVTTQLTGRDLTEERIVEQCLR